MSISEIKLQLTAGKQLILCLDFDKGSSVLVATGMNGNFIYSMSGQSFVFAGNHGVAPNHVRITKLDDITMHVVKLTKAKGMSVDLLSEYKILCQRGSLIRHNTNYAKEQIVNRYNEKFDRLSCVDLSEEDSKELFVLSHIGVICDGIDMSEGTFHLTHGAQNVLYIVRYTFRREINLLAGITL